MSTAGLRDQLQRDAGRERIDDRRMLALDRFPALHALLGVVAGFAFLDVELDAADAAVTLVEHVEIVVHAVGDRDAGIGVRPGPVGEQRHVDGVLRLGLAGEHAARQQPSRRQFQQSVVLPSSRSSLWFAPASGAPLVSSPSPDLPGGDFGSAALFATVGNWVLSCTINTETATPSVFACRSARAAQDRPVRRSGRR